MWGWLWLLYPVVMFLGTWYVSVRQRDYRNYNAKYLVYEMTPLEIVVIVALAMVIWPITLPCYLISQIETPGEKAKRLGEEKRALEIEEERIRRIVYGPES